MSEPWTIERLLHWSTDYLKGHGSESPRLDVELLLSEVLGLSRIKLYVEFDRPVMPAELARYKALLIRRAKHEPVAYILGRRGFHAIELNVGPGVLIPRPETEHLVDVALDFLNRQGSPTGPVLDVGTGSGAIALAVAEGVQQPRDVYATDVSQQALSCARQNAEQLGLGSRVHVLEGDLAGPAEPFGPFAAIVSNPPYVRTATIDKLQPTVKDHEPRLALDGGADGLDVLRRLVEVGSSMLAPGGLWAVELGDRQQGREVVELLQAQEMQGARYEAIGPGPTGIVLAYANAG